MCLMSSRVVSLVLLAVSAIGIAPSILGAQGGIVWPGGPAAPQAVVIRVDDRHFDVLFPGFATYPSTMLDGHEDVAVGVGIEPGSVRTVDEVEVVDETVGEELQLAPLFDFKRNTTVVAEFDRIFKARNQNKILTWGGFLAKPAASVPSFRGSTLLVRFSHVSAINQALFEKQIRGSTVAIAQVDSNGKPVVNPRFFMLKTAAVLRLPTMYYKFDRPIGDVALNFVNKFAGAPPMGKLISTGKAPLVSGWKGSALQGGDAKKHNSCDSGWKGGVGENFTIAWYVKQRSALGTSVSRFFEIAGGLRCFTNGAAGKGVRVTGWGSGVPALQFNVDMRKPAATKWVHLALVFYGSAKKVRLFVNGAPGPTLTISKTPMIPRTAATLIIGGQASAPNFYDIDEFRFAPFAAPNALVARWARAPRPATATYGTPSGCLMQTRNGPPAVGNGAFKLSILGPPKSKFAMVFGSPIQPWPFAGGTWNIQFPAVLNLGTLGSTGRLELNLGIPNNSALRGVVVNAQTFMSTPKNNGIVANVLAMAIE
jgi:Concanavalin A-like lectin/glucanases superfamily